MIKSLFSTSNERFIVVEDDYTRSGYRILQDFRDTRFRELKNWKYFFVITPDTPSNYIVIGYECGEVKLYSRVVEVFATMKEASDWVHDNKVKD